MKSQKEQPKENKRTKKIFLNFLKHEMQRTQRNTTEIIQNIWFFSKAKKIIKIKDFQSFNKEAIR